MKLIKFPYKYYKRVDDNNLNLAMSLKLLLNKNSLSHIFFNGKIEKETFKIFSKRAIQKLVSLFLSRSLYYCSLIERSLRIDFIWPEQSFSYDLKWSIGCDDIVIMIYVSIYKSHNYLLHFLFWKCSAICSIQ